MTCADPGIQVARSKDRIEESLASAISAIKDRLPGLDLYQHIYNEDHPLDNALQARIVSAYQGFIDVCIAATKYYKSGGPSKLYIHLRTPECRLPNYLTSSPIGRWLRALGMSDSFLDKANVVQQEIVDIRRLCDELLSKKVHSIKVLNECKFFDPQII